MLSSRDLLKTLNESLAKRGFVAIPKFYPTSRIDEIAEALGTISAIGSGASHPLRPLKKADVGPNTYSGQYGTGEFPPHTDLAHWRYPPRYILLRAVKGHSAVPTKLYDGKSILNLVSSELVTLAILAPRRPRNGSIPLLSLYRPMDDFGLLRWDKVYLRPANEHGRQAVAEFNSVLSSFSCEEIALTDCGDSLLIDNWRILHARGAVPATCEDRIVERIYLEALH